MNIETHSGAYVDFDEPEAETIHLEDIAHALAHTCRFGGHSSRFYSVAEHAVLVSRLAPIDVAFEALHHDDHEAYTGDIPTPLKKSLGDTYYDLAERLDAAIIKALDLDWFRMDSQAVHDADRLALRLEAAELKQSQGCGPHWGYEEPAQPVGIYRAHCWAPVYAKQMFLIRHRELAR